MMIKKQYIQELRTENPYIKRGMKGMDVKKIQEWINLWKRIDTNWNVSVSMDGDFGPGTDAAVRKFQQFHDELDRAGGGSGISVDGIVGNITWRKLTEPMRNAFTKIKTGGSLKELIVAYAQQHLKAAPREFKQNEGTWVRAYMDGYEGAPWAWCLGFVQTVFDQAAFTKGVTLKSYMPFSYSCDDMGRSGMKNGNLLENKNLPSKANEIEPGDIFLNVKKERIDWVHTGIVIKRDGDWIETIEGNTNDEGSREGYEVCARKRNFSTRKIDIFKVTPEIA